MQFIDILFLAKIQEVNLQEKTVICIIYKNILLMIEWILENTKFGRTTVSYKAWMAWILGLG